MSLYVADGYVLDNYVVTGIYVDWPRGVIFIPKDSTTLVQSYPKEIRELDLNTLRLTLKDLEDSDYGMVYQKTHNHNTTVTVSGVSLARVIEILDPYTITFEDGYYAVNLSGANSNVLDKTNVNNVSVRSSNSAGLVQSMEIENLSFSEGVTIDSVYGTDSSLYPYGTRRYPCKTTQNSYDIRTKRGLRKVYTENNLLLSGIPDGVLTDLEVLSDVGNKTFTVTVDNVLINNCHVNNLRVVGTVKTGSSAMFNNSFLDGLVNASVDARDSFINGGIFTKAELASCTLTGDIVLAEGCVFSGIEIVFDGDFTTIDLQGLISVVSLDVNSGYVKFINAAAGSLIELNIKGGEIELDPSCVAGEFYIEGYGMLYNNSTMTIKGDNLQSGLVKEAVAWSRKASDNAEQANLKL